MAMAIPGHMWWHLLFHPLDLGLQWSLLHDWAHVSTQLQLRGWLSHSISSKAATITRALQWASLTSARLLSLEASLLWGSCSLGAGCLLNYAPLTSVVFPSVPALGSLPRRTPPLPLVPALWVETLVASRVYTPHSRGTQSPSY